jgi:hypothetical protein
MTHAARHTLYARPGDDRDRSECRMFAICTIHYCLCEFTDTVVIAFRNVPDYFSLNPTQLSKA